ncbi:hypothetical protein GM418_28715 [Maribellus comscasis]|uniref:Glycosyl hydrolase family 32 N-terminal domain-containing protein n=2 Tax=Maribellus comscasis TaxID=2681766 RepID=A0A6I6K285_9BACT|nr:hypothetical protein GM418_28715 [Maribellus comscasis]
MKKIFSLYLLLVLSMFTKSQTKIATSEYFKLELDSEKPAFDITPYQPRMASCYQDKKGKYHLFTDYLEKGMSPYNAVIRYYRSSDLYHWEYVSTVAKHAELGVPDAVGCSSPHVLATDDKIYLFYGGTPKSNNDSANIYAKKGESGYMSRSIILAIAKADKNGAPMGNFEKHGVVITPGSIDDWDSMRLDDPCVIPDGDTLHLFYKAFNTNRELDSVRVGYAKASVNDLKFEKHPGPVLAVDGGGEMPRVFKIANIWHLFYRHFENEEFTWLHYTSDNGVRWRLFDPFFFKQPRTGPRDIMMIYGMNGKLLKHPKMLVAGNENDITRLWLYHLRKKAL